MKNEKNYYGVVDIGGTNMRLSIFLDSKKIEYEKFPSPDKPGDASKIIIDYYQNTPYKINNLCVGMAGPADYANGIFINPPSLRGWHNFDLKKSLSVLNFPNIKFGNDANLAALAYHHSLKKKENDITLFLTVSTGLGVGAIIKNEIFTGGTGQALEVALAPTSPLNQENYWGDNALEYFAAGSGMGIQANKIGIDSTKELFESKSPEAIKIVDNGINTLSNFIATILSILNPNTIIFDGSLSQYQPNYIKESMKRAMDKTSFHHKDHLEWFIGDMGDEAVLNGGNILCKEA